MSSEGVIRFKVKDITTNHSWNTQQKEKNVVLYIPPENSKTGKGRRVVAPIKKRVDRISHHTKELVTHYNLMTISL